MMGVREDIVAYARAAIGCEYSYIPSGGVEGYSYNCSFLTTCACASAGLEIPHWQGHQNGTGSQSDWVYWNGHWVTDPDDLKPGDLVFFGSERERTTHVGISLGGWDMIDSVPNGGVQHRTLYTTFVGGGWPLKDLPDSGDDGEWFTVAALLKFLKRTPIRSKPDGTDDGNIVGYYAKGDSCLIDRIYLNGTDRTWGSYLGLSSGKRRYISLGTHETVEVIS